MPIGLVGSASGSTGSSTTTALSVNKPTGLALGHAMVAALNCNGARNYGLPANWSPVLQLSSGTSCTLLMCYKAAEEVDLSTASYRWTTDQITQLSGGIAAYSGVDLANPIEAHSPHTSGAALTMVLKSVVTARADSWLLAAFGTHRAMQQNQSITPPSGFSERWDLGNLVTNNSYQSEYSDSLQASIGASGDKSATNNVGSAYASILAVLNPAVELIARSINDTVGLADNTSRGQARISVESLLAADAHLRKRNRNLIESEALTDSSIRHRARSIVEPAGLRDSLVKSGARILTDTSGLGDTLVRTRGLGLTDYAGVVDSLVKSRARSLTNTSELRDTLVRTRGLGLTDYAGVVDSLVKSRGRTLVDSEGVIDSYQRKTSRIFVNVESGMDSISRGIRRGLVEIQSLTDISLRRLARDFADPEALSDHLMQRFERSLPADSLLATDITRGSFQKLLFEGVGMVDTVVAHRAYARSLTDQLEIADSLSGMGRIAVLLSDALGLDDTAIKSHAVFRQMVDSLGLQDTLLGLGRITTTTAELLTVEDEVLPYRGISATFVENLTLRDPALFRSVGGVVVTDALGLEEIISPSSRVVRQAVERLGISDSYRSEGGLIVVTRAARIVQVKLIPAAELAVVRLMPAVTSLPDIVPVADIDVILE